MFLVSKNEKTDFSLHHALNYPNITTLKDNDLTTCENSNTTSSFKQITTVIFDDYRMPVVKVKSSLECSIDGISVLIFPLTTSGATCNGHFCIPQVAAQVPSVPGGKFKLYECRFYCNVPFLFISHIVVDFNKNATVCEIEFTY